ncbi:MAG: hypothetical protein ACFE0O_11295 [Opitutales bacterium]
MLTMISLVDAARGAATVEPTWYRVPLPAQAAAEKAFSIVAPLLETDQPIRVSVSFVEDGPAAYGLPHGLPLVPRGSDHPVWYPSALADAQAGRDLLTGQPDIDLFFRRDANWHFDAETRPPPGQRDFLTVVIHELLHGLGLATHLTNRAGLGSYGRDLTFLDQLPLTIPAPPSVGLPTLYDTRLVTRQGRPLTDPEAFPNPSRSLGAALGGPLFFSGEQARRANDGRPVRIYALSPSHLDPLGIQEGSTLALFGPSLPRNRVIHEVHPVLVAMLADLGWPMTAPVND